MRFPRLQEMDVETVEQRHFCPFQLSLFADLVWYTGIIDPVALVERIAKEAAVFGTREKYWEHQIANYIVEALNLRLIDRGRRYILFGRRLVGITGSDSAFSLSQVVKVWVEQAESRLSPERSIIRESALLVRQASLWRQVFGEEEWRRQARKLLLRELDRSALLAAGAVAVKPPCSCPDKPLVAEKEAAVGAYGFPAPERDCSIFALARVLSLPGWAQVLPIVKESHYVPWVERWEQQQARQLIARPPARARVY